MHFFKIFVYERYFPALPAPLRPKAGAVNTGYSFSSAVLRPHAPVFLQQTVNRNTGF
jgi:hypothetical protein